MKTVIKTFVALLLLGLVNQANAQSNKGLQLDLSASPFLIHFGDAAYSTTFNLGVCYSISQSTSFGLQFRQIYDFSESIKRYNASSSIGLGIGYVFFEGKDGTFWEDGSFEFLTDVGGGVSNFSDNEDAFLYFDLSCRAYISKKSYLSIGYNYKFYNNTTDNINGLYIGYGFKF